MMGPQCRFNSSVAVSVAASFVLAIMGCGGSSSSTDPQVDNTGAASSLIAEASQPGSAQAASAQPPTAAIGEPSAPIEFVEPEQGTPTWLIREILRIRGELSAAPNEDGTSPPPLGPEARQAHLNKVIDLAHQVIAATHQQPDQELMFNNAVRFLTDARIELALAGDSQAAELLVEDADLLYRRNPESFAAAEAGFKVVRLAQLQAEGHGSTDARWLQEYASQARFFAEKFPKEQSRAAVALLEAGRACDRQGLVDQARGCYETVAGKFSNSPFAEQVAGYLRRLSLAGQPLDLGGPTIDGGFASIDHYKDRVALIVFWSASSPTFREQLPLLKQVEQKFADRGLSLIGVNLDTDESSVDTFISEQELTWPQIFSPDINQRGAASPLARYYGIQTVPTYWLVDKAGIVREAPVEIEDLDGSVTTLLNTL